jgi:hypothetical protein
MKASCRLFRKAAAVATAAPRVPAQRVVDPAPVTKAVLDRILDAPVLQLDLRLSGDGRCLNCRTSIVDGHRTKAYFTCPRRF